jgi:hypothetical protein
MKKVLSIFGKAPSKRPDTSIDLSESQIRYAMMHSGSNMEAARFIGVAYGTYRKYAKMYIDRDTGRSLFELHLNQSGKGRTKAVPEQFRRNAEARKKYTGEKILANECPGLQPREIVKILIRDGFLRERCDICGLDEKRVYDKRTPLILHFRDGNKRNTSYDNIRLLCYNCYFYNVGEVRRGRPTRVVVVPGERESLYRTEVI